MATACRTQTCGESKSALGVGAQKKMRWTRVRTYLARLALSRTSNRHRNVSNKSHWCGQGGTNQIPTGGGKAHNFKPYQSEDQTKISSGVCRKVFSFSKKPEKGNCKDCASGTQTTVH